MYEIFNCSWHSAIHLVTKDYFLMLHRHRVEALFTYSAEFVHSIQRGQLDRYKSITSSVMSPAVAAKKTKEFRSSPREQVC